MQESQVTPAETPQQETSEPQAPSQPQPQVARKPLQDNAEQKQRAEQSRKREQVEKKNPFSRENKMARQKEFLKTLRQERGVAEPQQREAQHEQRGANPGGGDAAGGSSEHGGQSAVAAAPKDTAVSEASQNTEQKKGEEVPEWYKRQEQLRVAEQRATQASADAEKQRAAAEKAKADAEAAVQRMAAAKEDPVQFLAEAGMTQEEWSNFLANGGKLTPEQKQLKAMADEMAKLRERADAAEKKAADRDMQARMAAEESQFAQELQKFTYVPEMGGVAAVRERQRLLSAQTGQPVSLSDAAEHLEQDMRQGLERVLRSPKIRSSLKLDVNTSNAGQAAETPRTLSNRVSSESSQTSATPHPLDWAAKRRLYEQRVQRERAAKSGR